MDSLETCKGPWEAQLEWKQCSWQLFLTSLFWLSADILCRHAFIDAWHCEKTDMKEQCVFFGLGRCPMKHMKCWLLHIGMNISAIQRNDMLPLKMTEISWKMMHAPGINLYCILRSMSFTCAIRFVVIEEWWFYEAVEVNISYSKCHMFFIQSRGMTEFIPWATVLPYYSALSIQDSWWSVIFHWFAIHHIYLVGIQWPQFPNWKVPWKERDFWQCQRSYKPQCKNQVPSRNKSARCASANSRAVVISVQSRADYCEEVIFHC